MGVESAHFSGIVDGGSLLDVFCCLLGVFCCRAALVLEALGQFEGLVFVVMSTRENIRLITRTPLICLFERLSATLRESIRVCSGRHISDKHTHVVSLV